MREVRISGDTAVVQRAHKAPGGLLRAVLETRAGRIVHASLSGDFFCYPADALGGLEDALAGTDLARPRDVLEAYLGGRRVVTPGGRIVVIDKNAEQWGRFETPKWEKWFKRDELIKLLSKHCREVNCRPISYWEDVEPDGLFLAWTATR